MRATANKSSDETGVGMVAEMVSMGSGVGSVERAMAQRRAAMAALKQELARRERQQTWLIRRLEERNIIVSRARLSNYLNGYRRVPDVLLGEMCSILGTTKGRIVALVDDEATLIQAKR